MRVIGLDVHRTFATVAVLDNTQLFQPNTGDSSMLTKTRRRRI
jgi:hypothetical protein